MIVISEDSESPIRIFKQRCIEDSGVAASVVDAISLIPLIHMMITNTRCAVFASNKVVALLKAMPSKLSHQGVVGRVRHAAKNIVMEVAQEFMKVGNWGKMEKENHDYLSVLARAMLTLPETQKRSYLLLTPQVQRDLCCRLGSIFDFAAWQFRRCGPMKHRPCTSVYSKGAFPLWPERFFFEVPVGSQKSSKYHRFDFSPAMIMIALLHLAGLRSTGSISATAFPSPTDINSIVMGSLNATLCHLQQHRFGSVLDPTVDSFMRTRRFPLHTLAYSCTPLFRPGSFK
jgi:hypothetical protein